jgi:uroporphyrinogen-III synthase
MSALPLSGRTIAIPETREAEVFAALLERRGARVIRCPLVAIRDAPDPHAVLGFCRELANDAFDDLILLTGEGLRRMLSCIEQHAKDLHDPFVAALGRVRKITRGPKPARALRELGLRPDIAAAVPTSQGIIEALSGERLAGRRVGLQLYGTEPNERLQQFLAAAGSHVRTVAPYVYAHAADERAVLELLGRMRAGEVDAIAFTSTPQVERLFAVADAAEIRAALERSVVAAVGPVVAEALARREVPAQVMPAEAFFLKPLTSELEAALAARGARRPAISGGA